MAPAEKLYLNERRSNVADIKEKINGDHMCTRELYIENPGSITSMIYNFLPNMSNLTTLSITGANMRDVDAHTIANFITSSRLTKLELRYCMEDDVLAIIANSIEASALQTLVIAGHNFAKYGSKSVTNAIEKSFLTKISFISCTFHDDELVQIMNTIKKSTLKTLMLNNNQLHGEEIIAIANCIANAKLTKLSLCGTFIEDARAIFEAIKGSTIKTLDVRQIPFFESVHIINSLILDCDITNLRFDPLILNVEERITLLNSIQKKDSFEHISIGHTSCDTNELTIKMCDILVNLHLKSLYLDCRRIPDEMLSKIVASIKKSSIVSLEFKSNLEQLSIVKDLLENCCLEKLKLHLNWFIDNKIREILPSIQISSVIKFNVVSAYERMDGKLRDEIDQVLLVRQQSVRNCCNTKSARMLIA